jgi:thymidylate synthase (FAD)
MELNQIKNNQKNFESIVRYPYGQTDPYALIELVAATQIFGDKYSADQMPVLSARVSHAGSGKTGLDQDADIKLMAYLAQNEHHSPFEHQSATFRVVVPLFVSREWMRHRTQSYNEISMRYSSDQVGKFHYPSVWREQATRNKQSSAGAVEDQEGCTKILKDAYENALTAYKALLEKGVCREQARFVVPFGNYTEFYVTANLRNWLNFYRLRIAEGAQWEIRQYAKCIDEIFQIIWPNSWSVLKQSLKN